MPSKLQLLASVLIHATVAVVWFGPTQLWQLVSFEEQTATLPSKQNAGTRFVTEKRLDEPEKRPQPKPASTANVPPVEKQQTGAQPPRRDYAGAPPESQAPQLKEEPAVTASSQGARSWEQSPAASDRVSVESISTATVTLSPAPDRKRLMAADQPRTEGTRVPIIDVDGLTSDGIDDIVSAGLGLLLVECDSQAVGGGVQRYVVKGSVRLPTQLIPVAAHELHSYSERALRLPSTDCAAVRKQLKADYAVAEPQLSRCRYLLFLTNGLDQQIYGAQCRAASSLGITLDQLAVTTGRFEQAGTTIAFLVIAVTRQDGKRFALLQ